MKVCFVTSTYPLREGDGIPAFVAALAERLVAEHGMTVRVVAPHHPGVPHREIIRGVSVERFQYTLRESAACLAVGNGIPDNLKNYPRAKWQVPGFLAAMGWAALRVARECDLVHAHWVEPGFLAVSTRPLHRRPVLVTVHSMKTGGPSAPVYRRTLGAADEVLFNSRFTMQQAAEAGFSFRGRVAYQGFDEELFRTAPPRGATRAALGIPAGATVVATVGRFVPFKGMDVLAAASAEILRDRPDVHVVIGGDGVSRPAVEAALVDNPFRSRVHLPGALDRAGVRQLLADADLFVIPSVITTDGKTESLGVTTLEAMASGLACVGSRVGGITETIVDGETGFLVPPSDPAALAAAVGRLIDDPALRARMGNAGHERAWRQFGWSALAREVAGVYREILAARLTA